jgi:hypothetical protein
VVVIPIAVKCCCLARARRSARTVLMETWRRTVCRLPRRLRSTPRLHSFTIAYFAAGVKSAAACFRASNHTEMMVQWHSELVNSTQSPRLRFTGRWSEDTELRVVYSGISARAGAIDGESLVTIIRSIAPSPSPWRHDCLARSRVPSTPSPTATHSTLTAP